MAVKRITAIGDSIVDTVSRGGVTDTNQWLYKLMQRLGETDIYLEPLPECSLTPNALENGGWAAEPTLCDGDLTNYKVLTGQFTITLSTYFETFAFRVFTQDTAFTATVHTSTDNATWELGGTITKTAGHAPGWSHCNWGSGGRPARYVRVNVVGNMTVSEVQVVFDAGNDRGTCLNKIVGTNYIVNNVGLGSAKTDACLGRFSQDVVDIGSDYVIILVGINDIAGAGAVDLTTVEANLSAMYDEAQRNGIEVIPCTLLPYAGKPELFDVINPRIIQLNKWIRETAAVRRFNLSDWYYIMEDPGRPGYIVKDYVSTDGVHLNVAGCDAIINGYTAPDGTFTRPPAFDVNVFTAVHHDFYATPVVEIELDGYRTGDTAYFEFWNGIEKSFRVYASGVPGVNAASQLLATVNAPLSDLGVPQKASFSINTESGSYYRVYGVDTGVWSNEVFVVGKTSGRSGTVITPFPMQLGR